MFSKALLPQFNWTLHSRLCFPYLSQQPINVADFYLLFSSVRFSISKFMDYPHKQETCIHLVAKLYKISINTAFCNHLFNSTARLLLLFAELLQVQIYFNHLINLKTTGEIPAPPLSVTELSSFPSLGPGFTWSSFSVLLKIYHLKLCSREICVANPLLPSMQD